MDGAAIADALLGKGYMEMMPERAGLYLASLCNGAAPLATDGETYAFLKDPPAHPYHYHYDTGDDLYDRVNLERDGLKIDSLRL